MGDFEDIVKIVLIELNKNDKLPFWRDKNDKGNF